MYGEIVSVIQSAKALGELVKAANGLANYTEFVAAVSEVSTKLMDATAVALASQEKQSALANRIKELENQLREIENLESSMKRYQLHEFPTQALAYALQQGMEQGQPMHYLCTACVDKKQKTTLQTHGLFLKCPVCKSDIQIQKSPRQNYANGGSWMSR